MFRCQDLQKYWIVDSKTLLNDLGAKYRESKSLWQILCKNYHVLNH